MDIKIANEHPSIDDAFERTIKDIGIPPRPIIIDHVVAEMRKEAPNFDTPTSSIWVESLLPMSVFPPVSLRRSIHPTLVFAARCIPSLTR